MGEVWSRRVVIGLGASAACGMMLRDSFVWAQDSAPVFDVSTVKPAGVAPQSTSGIDTEHGRIDAQNVTLKRCIIGAYGVGPHQVVGGPDWIDSDRFDIQGKSEQPTDDDDVMNAMLQRLLADRFKLVLHRETRPLEAYVLEVDKRGARLEKADGGDSDTNTSTRRGGRVKIQARNTGMDLLAQILARELDLPVVNQTGLSGVFNFSVHWAPDSILGTEQATADDVSVFTALPEQLGLRLRKAKVGVEVLVVDHAEHPSAN